MILVGPLVGFVGFSLFLNGIEWLFGFRNSFYKRFWGFASIVTGIAIMLIALVI